MLLSCGVRVFCIVLCSPMSIGAVLSLLLCAPLVCMFPRSCSSRVCHFIVTESITIALVDKYSANVVFLFTGSTAPWALVSEFSVS
jgi:hypothetical protein